MSIITIEPATREGMRFLISLYGLSETGKTLSGLKLAAGMEPNPAKRGLLDTEGGQRGRAYVDHIQGGYLYGALTPPFTPERYIEAIAEFEKAGVNVLVIDSVSHAWFAEGGILDMVENATQKNDLAKWAGPKRRLGKMTKRILSSDMHIILCSRAKEPLIEGVVDGRKTLVKGPVVPIQEKSLRYDMTIMAQMLGDGKFTVAAPQGKCPGVLRDVFAASPVMSEETGRRLIAWLGEQPMKSADTRGLEAAAKEQAEAGSEAFRAYWQTLTTDQRAALKPMIPNLQSIAKAADDERARKAAEAAAEQANGDHDLSDPFKIDTSTAAPASAEIAVPMDANGKPDWQGFINLIVRQAEEAGDKQAIEDLRTANRLAIAAMERASADWKVSLDDQLSALIAA